ncbi:putative reverse transcriptase domain-containing protein [Tanacetum coccineum]
MFHLSNLKKCYANEPIAVMLDGLHIDDKLHFVEESVKIMDREVKRLRQILVPIFKVRWNSRRGPEFTWECEDQFRKKYPHLFTKTAPSSTRDTDRSMNGDDSHNLGTGVRRQAPFACKTVGHDIVYAMTWTNLKKKMTDKYCPRAEIKKLEVEMWNLKVRGTDVVGYNQHVQELALMCVWMFPEESDKIEKYVGGLPDMIHGSVMASKPKTMQDAIEFATELMDKKINTLVERQVENKRKLVNNNQAQQQPLRRKCTIKCANCKRVGHLIRDYKNPATTHNQRNLTCYECGNQGHYRSDCPKRKNQNHENQTIGTGARGVIEAVAYKLKLPQELSMVHNTFHVSNLKKCYADEPLAVPLDGLHIDDKLHYVKEPIKIMDRDVKWLRQGRVPIV